MMIRACLFLALILSVHPSPSFAGIASLWAVNDGEKIEQDDTANPNKAANSAWDGEKIIVFGARNEIIAFQVIVEADAGGIEGLRVSLPKLTQRGGTSAIVYTPPAANPTVYTSRPISIFTEHYLNVEKSTHASWFYPPDLSHPAAPEDPTGLKPVQLVPENARAGTGGFPLSVAPGMNQAVWIEIYLAKDLPAGMYDGTLTVAYTGGSRTLPVELELFDFTLPDENSMRAMIYFEESQLPLYHGSGDDSALTASYYRFAHRQRMEFVHAYTESTAPPALYRFTGKAYTKAAGYDGPGAGTGDTIIPRTFYGPGRDFETDEDARSNADSWMRWLNANLPGKTTFIYMPDEPREDAYPVIHAYAHRIHDNPGPGGKLPVFVTAGYSEGLDGGIQAIDIWCSFYGHYSIERGAIERSHGDDMWIYNGMRPYGGALLIDTPAVDARSNIWACFKHGIPVYFYWHANHWRHNGQIPDGLERNQNVWADPITYKNKGGSFANGDGCLIYPGRDVLHPSEDRGIDGPCPTIVLANLRRGLQDHLYLTIARQKGLDDLVEQALDGIVPFVLSDVEKSDGVSFPESGNPYEAWRYLLGEAIGRKGE